MYVYKFRPLLCTLYVVKKSNFLFSLFYYHMFINVLMYNAFV
jgi:hypothetical protein